MRKVAVKGKEWGFKVGESRTIITGPKGRHAIENARIATGPITPGKMINFIVKEFY